MMKTNNHPENAGLTSGRNISYWTDTVHPLPFNPLNQNLETDTVIVGGGIAGLSVAYCLAKAGRDVVLVEDGFVGSGETGRTTAHLVTALDDRYYELAHIFGEEKTRLIAESHRAAILFVEDTIRTENIDCEFERVNGYLFLHPTDKKDALQRELEAAQKAGIEVYETAKAPGMFQTEPALCFPGQAQFHPLKYLKGLVRAIEKKGGRIFTGTHAAFIDHKGITSTNGFRVNARNVVAATNSPVNSVLTMSLKQFAYRSYVIGALIEKGAVPKALWWDTGNFETNPNTPPYHYVRIQPYNDQQDLLICGGEDHPTGDTSQTHVPEENRYSLLETWARKHFPVGEIIYRWSGQVMEPMDGIAFIGRNPFDHENVYIVTGDSGNGMTHGSLAGLLISDLIAGKENKWEKIYRPSRFTLKESGSAFKEFMQGLISYLKTVPGSKTSETLSAVKNGEASIVKLPEKKCGVYRDESGQLHIVSAECTHLKCTVSWNKDELSWDCPCHGSRFTFEGKVINGPANADLPAFSESAVMAKH